MWRNRFGGGSEPVVRQNTKWMMNKLTCHFSDDLWKYSCLTVKYLQYYCRYCFFPLLVSFERWFMAAVSKCTWQCDKQWTHNKPLTVMFCSSTMPQTHTGWTYIEVIGQFYADCFNHGDRTALMIATEPPLFLCSHCFNHSNINLIILMLWLF
jgi:hypothetical protein